MARSKISRNDLCLCGSGKKYKNCCMIKDHEKVIMNSEIDRDNRVEKEAIATIMQYVNSKENRQDFEVASRKYFGGNLSEIKVSDSEFNFFITWYLNHYVSDIMARLIKSEQKNSSDDVKIVLQNLNQSGLYFYKVINIKDNRLTIENLHNSSVLEVIDSVLEENVDINDVLYTRVYNTGRFNRVFGGSMLVPDFILNEVLEESYAAWEAREEKLDYEDFIQIYALDIIRKLNQNNLDDRLLYNEENELLQYSITKYKVLERAKCHFILEGMKEFVQKKDELTSVFQWLKNKGDMDFVMAEISILEEELSVETDSFERKENIQKLLEDHLKDIIEFVDEDYFTITQLQEQTQQVAIQTHDALERLILDHMKIEYKPLYIKAAILLAKAHKIRLKGVKPEGIAAAIEYIIATQLDVSKTQKNIAHKYNVSPATVGKWVKDINEYNKQE